MIDKVKVYVNESEVIWHPITGDVFFNPSIWTRIYYKWIAWRIRDE